MADLSDSPLTLVIPVKDEDLTVLTQLLTEAKTLRIPTIVVDDGSTPPCPLATLRVPVSQGYGAALKAGIAEATTPYVVTMDGDGQHNLMDVLRLAEFALYFPHLKMVIGDRRLRERGTRLWGRKGLNWLATLFAGRWIADLNSGLRIIDRQLVTGYAPILCDQFSFTTSLTLAMLTDGYPVDWLPIKVAPRTHGQSKVKLWQDGWRTVCYIVFLGTVLRTRRLRAWLRGSRPIPCS